MFFLKKKKKLTTSCITCVVVWHALYSTELLRVQWWGNGRLQKQEQTLFAESCSYVHGALQNCCCTIVSGNSVIIQDLLCSYWFFFPCLQTTKDDLLLTDFEGALKFFRVQLPKRYRSEENAKKLMELACNMKVKMW